MFSSKDETGRRPAGFWRLPVILLLAVAIAFLSKPSSGFAPVQINLAATTSPVAAQPGVTTVTLVCSALPAGTITPANLAVTLQPAAGTLGPNLAANVTAFGTLPVSGGRITFQVSGPNVAVPTAYLVSVSGTTLTNVAFESAKPASLTINPPPQILSISPGAALPGRTVPVTITGQFTNYVQGSTAASFGPGISVGSAAQGKPGLVTVMSPTTAAAQLTIDPAATPGLRSVTVATGLQVATADLFSISAVPALLSIAPNSGQQGQTNLSVTINGNFTHFTAASVVTFSGSGVMAGVPTAATATSLTVPVTIAGNAPVGAQGIQVVTGAETVSLSNAFTVTNGTPVLTTVNPNTGVQGQTNESVSLTGQFTHWVQGTSTAGFGAGITVATLTVNSATSATAVLNIAGAAAAGARNVTVTTGGEVVTLNNGFTVTNGTPVLTTVNPNTGVQGQSNESVSLTGQFTHWVQGTSTASFGAGITVATLTVNSATSATAVLNIAAAAAAGARNVTVTTGGEVVTLNNGFTVTNGTPVLTTVNPNTGVQGQTNESVSLTGQFTHWVQGTSTASFGAGITVATLTVNSTTSATAVLNIDPAAAAGARNVAVTTGGEVVTLNNGFTVTNGTPVLTTVNPNTGVQGQTNESVSLTGQFTHWVQGTSTASFGAGITVATLTVNSATSATAVLNIAAAAAAGARNVTVTTGGEVVTLNNGFTVTNGTPVLTTVNPNTGVQGQTNESVSLTGQFTHWVQGTSTASFGAGITVATLTVNSTTSATAVLNIDPAAAAGARNVTVTMGGEVVTLNNGFTVTNGTPVLTTVNPNTGVQGQSNESVSLTGQFTHWVQGSSTASFGAGVTVATLTVNSATSATAVLNIDPAAAAGARNVTVTTGGEVVTLNNGFTVTNGTPVLTTVNPNTGVQGQTNESVSLTGQFTHLVQGTSTASFGAGITVASLTVNSTTSATAVLNIAAAAAAGARNVAVTTGGEVVTLNNGFTVTNGTPVLTTVNPNTGVQGQTNESVSLTGQFTHWVQGTSTASFGAGITVATLTVNSTTSATAVLNIDPAAAAGARNVTVTTGGEVVTLNNGFTVTNGTPVLTTVNPNTGVQGQTNESVSLTGQFTHWVQGTSTASFGAGITVATLTVNSTTSATAVLNIDPAAAAGARNVTVTTGGEVVTLNNGFTVTNGTPVLTTVNPNTGVQGQTNESVSLTGQFTHWVQGTSTASFGAGITVATLTVNSATSATAVLNIAAAAAAGARNVTVTTGGEVVTLNNGFTVTNGTPVLTTVNPNTGLQGQTNESVSLTGQFTHWVQGTSTASFGAGITVATLTVNSATSATAVLNIAAAAAAGARNVTVTTGAEVVTLNNGFTVTAGAPVLTTVNPNTGQQGQANLSVTISGNFTHFTAASVVTFIGGGVTVGVPTASTAISVTVPVTIAANAPVGAQGVQVVTGAETVSLANAFTVTQSAGVPTLISTSPGSALQGQSVQITITAQNTHFQQGVTKANFGSGVSVGGGPPGALGLVQVTNATTAIASVTVPASAATGSRTVFVQTGTEDPSLVNGFVVKGTPFLSSISPNSAQKGQTISVTIQGVYTSFQQGVTTANFGSGISVGGGALGASGPVTVTGAGTAMAQLTVDAAAATGLRNPVVQTGAEQASLVNSGFTVLGTVTGPPPVVSIANPAEGSEVSAPVTVTGTATSSNLSNWILEYEASGSTVFTRFGSGTAAAVSASLDPSLLLNGIAQIRLTAMDLSGQTSSVTRNVVITKKAKIGNFTLSFNDLTVPVAGIPIQVIRSYDSRNKSSGDFGFGWTLDIKTTKIQSNGLIGDGWQGTKSGGFLPTYCVVPPTNRVISISLQDGTVFKFQPTTPNGCAQVIPPEFVDVTFTPVGTTPPKATLTAPGGVDLFVVGSFPGDIQLIDFDTFETFDPDQFVLTLPNGQKLNVSKTAGLQSMADRNGNTLTFSATGITSSTGKSVAFARDAQNRIKTITDPSGKILNYTYSATGDLTTFTDRRNNVSTFTYDSFHDLISFVDASGHQPIRNVYDDSGRLIQVIDAFGNVKNLTHNLGASTETVSDALGNQTTLVYDSHGNVLSVTDPLGNITTSTYDANDNLLTETDPLGHAVTFTYDANGNRLSQTDAQGHTITQTYDAFGNVLTTKDPNGNTRTNTYDARGNMLTTTDALGKTTTWTYDARGNQTATTDALGRTTNYTYDGSGNLATLKDPAGVITTYAYDANNNRLSQSVTRTTPSGPQTLVTQYQFDADNNLIKTTNPDGTTRQKTFNETGLPVTEVDELGRTTQYIYNEGGGLTQTTFPDGTHLSAVYDANGRRTQVAGRSGAGTSFTLDAAGRPVATHDLVTGASTQTTYDAAGRRVAVTDPLGHTTQFTYDAADRRTSITDALNKVTTFTYDAVGNQTSFQDANGHTTSNQYDANNHLFKTVYADSTFDQVTYDAFGKMLSKTDAAGKTTQYAYDSRGRLITVTDARGGVTSYAYDEVGNRISQTDANGHTTTFAYDARGRRTQRKLPGGQTESFTYDSAGNVTSHTDFNGKVTTYTYDSSNRLLSKTPDASFLKSPVTYAYLLSGRRASMTDSIGTTTYTYDASDRLTQVAKPNGTISYTYNLAGSLTALNTSGGTQVTYGYDVLNRLSTVLEPGTGLSTYTYDPAGNMSGVAYPNTVTHAYTYNTKDQLTNLSVNKGASAIAGYGYTLNATGRRLSVAELGGRVATYTYDNIYRLTAESISGAPGGPNGNVSYTYDPAGNRLQTTSTLAGVPSGVFTYDVNDRLATDTYDSDGNTVSSGGTANVYDFENHLIQHGGVTIAYDGDGNRVSKTVGGVTTKYLVDDLNPTGFAQVIEETVSDGSTRKFVYGLQRISQKQFVASSSTTLTSFYVYDGHGSVRALTNTAGTVTDTYDYDAYGNLIHSTGSTPNEFLFAGEQFDADLGLYYSRARYLNPVTGRFWTLDSIDGDPESPITLHKYLYGNADPVNVTDPSGHEGDLGSVMVSIAISSSLDAISSFVLNSPLGSSAIGWVATHLLPSGFFDSILGFAPDAGLVGGSISGNVGKKGIPAGITFGGGLDLLVGRTLNAALYGYLGGGLTIGATSKSASVEGHAGVVWNTPDSDAYTKWFFNVSFPVSVLPAKITSKLKQDFAIVALASTIGSFDAPPEAKWIIDQILSLGASFLTDGAITFFTDPTSYPNGSSGFSFGIGKALTKGSSTNIGITGSYFWQLWPGGIVPFR